MLLEAVRRAMYWDELCGVYWGVGESVYWGVHRTVSRAMRGAVNRAVTERWAGAQREEPLHLELGLYLGGVGG